MTDFFAAQPEFFYSINNILSTALFGVSFVKIIGAFFIFAALVVFFFLRKNFSNEKIISCLFIVFLIFWLPLYSRLFFNNFFQLLDAFEYSRYDVAEKRIIRFCNLDYNQKIGGYICQMFSFLKKAKNDIPAGEGVAVLSDPWAGTFLSYYLLSDFKIQKDIFSSPFLLFYFPPGYSYQNGRLYEALAGGFSDRGEYSLVSAFDANRLILKKEN